MENNLSESDHLRLQVYLARCGVGSRRSCEAHIAEGRVTVNGRTVREQGVKVACTDEVRFDGKPVHPEAELRYIALNKPPKYLCSNSDPRGRPLAVDLLSGSFAERLFHVGRLDFMSEGLVFFTNDGTFANIVGHPSSEIEKEYRVELSPGISRKSLIRHLDRAQRGVYIENERYRIRSYHIEKGKPGDTPLSVRITLIEGKNREIRRIFDFFDAGIRRLVRIRIGSVKLDDLAPGEFRQLHKEEVEWFFSRTTT